MNALKSTPTKKESIGNDSNKDNIKDLFIQQQKTIELLTQIAAGYSEYSKDEMAQIRETKINLSKLTINCNQLLETNIKYNKRREVEEEEERKNKEKYKKEEIEKGKKFKIMDYNYSGARGAYKDTIEKVDLDLNGKTIKTTSNEVHPNKEILKHNIERLKNEIKCIENITVDNRIKSDLIEKLQNIIDRIVL